MKEEKYYTPDLEEFYFGFEYEHKNPTQDNIWKKEIVDSDMLGIVYSTYEETPEDYPNEIRVKYLDQEDIESLGFILKGKTIDLWFEKEGITLRKDGHHFKNIKLQYGLHDNRLKITGVFVGGKEECFFQSKIKNKSELIKLLKQLEI